MTDAAKGGWIKAGLLVAVVIGLFTASWFLPVGTWVEAFTHWIQQQGPLGVLYFMCGYVLATVLFFPDSLFTIAAGIVFGLFWGTLIALISATIGATLAFLIGRYLAREPVEKWSKNYRIFGALDSAIGANDWKVIGLLRLSPLVPFNLSNYFFGVTQARLWAYVAASLVGMTPGVFMYAYLGYAGKATLGHTGSIGTSQIALLSIGLVATIVVIWYVTRLARKELQKKNS